MSSASASLPLSLSSLSVFSVCLVVLLTFLYVGRSRSRPPQPNTLKSPQIQHTSAAAAAAASAAVDSAQIAAGLASHERIIRRFLTSLHFPLSHSQSPALPSLQAFEPVKSQSNCIFAKNSKIWGSAPWDASLSLERNILSSLPSLIEFTMKIQYLSNYIRVDEETMNQQWEMMNNNTSDTAASVKRSKQPRLVQIPMKHRLDGYLFEIVGPEYCNSVDDFSRTVHRVLATISKYDPLMTASDFQAEMEQEQEQESVNHEDDGEKLSEFDWDDFLSRYPDRPTPIPGQFHHTPNGLPALPAPFPFINSPSWHYHFMGEPFFITCFAPIYPRTHARYMFSDESPGQRCFIMLQPEFSFAMHNLTLDSPHTNWTNPQSERDQIRVSFKNAGREYTIPPSVIYPSSNHIVPPVDTKQHQEGDHSDGRHSDVVRWWETRLPGNDDEEAPGLWEEESDQEEDEPQNSQENS